MTIYWTTDSAEIKYCIKNNITEHPSCDWCGNTSGIRFDKNNWRYVKYCSSECRYTGGSEKTKQTNLARRGVSSNFNDPGQRERIEQTLLNRYGVSNPFESPVFQEKAKKTRLLRYGDEIYSNPSKASDTKLTRYGEGHKKIVDKIKETKLNKYGDENFNNRPKAIGTNISKYGVENTSQVVDIHERMQKSRWYTIISPSCIEYKVQGYERFVVPILWKTYTEDTLVLHRAKMPAVFYIGNDTKKHRYYPDIYLKEEKTIIDVKSTWWLKLSVPKLEKLFPRCNELGYIFKIILYDKGEMEYLNTIEEVYSKVKTL